LWHFFQKLSRFSAQPDKTHVNDRYVDTF